MLAEYEHKDQRKTRIKAKLYKKKNHYHTKQFYFPIQNVMIYDKIILSHILLK